MLISAFYIKIKPYQKKINPKDIEEHGGVRSEFLTHGLGYLFAVMNHRCIDKLR